MEFTGLIGRPINGNAPETTLRPFFKVTPDELARARIGLMLVNQDTALARLPHNVSGTSPSGYYAKATAEAIVLGNVALLSNQLNLPRTISQAAAETVETGFAALTKCITQEAEAVL